MEMKSSPKNLSLVLVKSEPGTEKSLIYICVTSYLREVGSEERRTVIFNIRVVVRGLG